VGYWPFCGNANDESGNGNDGAVNGATLAEDRFGNAGSAYSFDGLDDYIIANDAYPSPLNYYGFPRSCCTSANECICHGIPDTRPIADGDIINLDVSVYKDGFHADMNETYLVG
jgi:hypothetical protein